MISQEAVKNKAPQALSRIGNHKNLEAISRIWIRFESKAQVGKKAEHTREYVSILSRPVTPLSGLRRVFEMASKVLETVVSLL